MRLAALTLIAAGLLLTATGLFPWPFDFAVAVKSGWHVTVFPPPLFVGVLLIMSGIVALLASLLWH
jgi:hypothetical protein